MVWIIIVTSLLVLISIALIFVLQKFRTSVEGFDMLLTKFIEVNQNFYDGQKTTAKKDKEIIDTLTRQFSELGIMRKYSVQINNSIRNINETIKSLKDNQKEIKSTIDELNVSKDIASSLAVVSGNIRLLDNIAKNLGQSLKELEELKRRK